MIETQEKAVHSLDDEDSLDEDSYSDEELSNENNDVLEEDLDNNPSSSSNISRKCWSGLTKDRDRKNSMCYCGYSRYSWVPYSGQQIICNHSNRYGYLRIR